MKLNKQQREQLKQKYGGHCAYCGDLLPDRWHADHIEPIKRTMKYDKDKFMFVYDGGCERPENNHIDNFNPSCPSCNIIKHANTLEGFRKIIGGFITSLNRDSTQYKFAKRYGLLEEREVEVKFYYEMI
ncbi:HNH endonuclease [Sphingobacterium faecium]|uniref:HNH endonuclease n=1 Tax=Sphingobacterium faecium TaxID=34087 RepID=UPI0021B6109D|nr:HNH endonuclease signature motif containing protein [Sphingobacterium faecium]UXD67725.1 HNH endonuclease [Sphingobacterium faecium]